MGLNLCVQTLEGKRHPDWDDGRYAGDRQFFDVVKDIPSQDHLIEYDWFWRPADFSAMRAANWPEDNQDRWSRLADILEENPDYWVYPSV